MSKFTNSVCSLLNLLAEPITIEMRCKYLSIVMKIHIVGSCNPHSSHDHKKLAKNCPHELEKGATHANTIMLFD